MSQLSLGETAPSFRLAAAQGGEVGPQDYAGRRNLILFFAKGMACGFCRQKMSQLARGAPRFRALDTDVVMVTPTPIERGRFYARSFSLPFPYLCDPDYRVFEAYGMSVREHALLWKARVFAHVARMPKLEATELGKASPSPGEFPRLLNDDDLGFFVADKRGTVRYASTAPNVDFDGARPVGIASIPSTEDIVAVLERCDGRGERQPA